MRAFSGQKSFPSCPPGLKQLGLQNRPGRAGWNLHFAPASPCCLPETSPTSPVWLCQGPPPYLETPISSQGRRVGCSPRFLPRLPLQEPYVTNLIAAALPGGWGSGPVTHPTSLGFTTGWALWDQDGDGWVQQQGLLSDQSPPQHPPDPHRALFWFWGGDSLPRASGSAGKSRALRPGRHRQRDLGSLAHARGILRPLAQPGQLPAAHRPPR